MKETILKVENLSKFFKNRSDYKVALDNISFNVDQGDFLGIIGESGSGKTTLGRTIINLERASSGKIQLFDKITTGRKQSKDVRNFLCKNMQMIFQDPLSSLNPKMNVLRVISEPIVINKSMKIEATEIIKKRQKLNFLFEYDILKDLVINKHEHLSMYYEEYQKLIQEMLVKIENFQFTNKNSWTESFAELETVYDYFIHAEKKIIKIINTMYEKIDHILRGYEAKVAKKEIDKIFLKYIELNEKLEQLEKEFNAGKNSIDELNDKLKEIDAQIYTMNNSTLITGELNDLRMHIKSNTNAYKIAKTKRAYNYNYLLVVRDKFKKNVLAEFKKFQNVEDATILNEYSLIKNQVDTFFKNKSIELFEGDLQHNYELKMDSVDFEAIEGEIDKILSTALMEIKKKLEIINEKNSIIVNNYINEKNKIALDIKSLKAKKEETKGQFSTSPGYLKTHGELTKVKEEILRIRELKKREYETFKNGELKALADSNKAKKLAVKTSKGELVKKLKALNKDLVKIRPTDLEKFSKMNAIALVRTNTKAMLGQLKVKLSSLNLIDFEIKKILEYYDIEERICSSNPYTLSFYKSDIQKILILNKVFNLLELVGLKKEHAYRYPHEFSGGQRQRIVIARALINDPKMIIADEAVSALDVSVQAQVINMMKELSEKRNVTFLFIAHDLSMVRYICNKVIIMHNGKILEKGLVNKIFKNPVHPYTKSLLKAVPELSKMNVDLSLFEDDSNYAKDYSIYNMPNFIKVENDHEVLATEKQFKEWAR
ncbi:MAG: ATP-binding cassette domain-containing protein [Mycoplasmoidaceae bacterium]